MIHTDKEIENCLRSELSNFVTEFKNNTLTEEGIINYFRIMLTDANVNSDIIINVLESKEFGKIGEDEAFSIKCEFGY